MHGARYQHGPWASPCAHAALYGPELVLPCAYCDHPTVILVLRMYVNGHQSIGK